MTIQEMLLASNKLYGQNFTFEIDQVSLLCNLIIFDRYEPNFTYTEHAHSFYEFHYVYDGYGQLGINGVEYPLEKGDLYLTGPSMPHWQTSSPSDPMQEICLRIIAPVDAKSDTLKLLDKCTYPCKDTESILYLLEHIFMEALNENLFSNKMIALLLSQFIYIFTRLFSDAKTDQIGYAQDIDITRMHLINSYIYDNLERPIICKDIAAHIFICKRQLTRIMLRHTGMTPHKYITVLRLNKAKDLIESTNLPLKKIALMTGFSSEFHLSSTIKKHYQTTPKNLRQKTTCQNRDC